MSHRKVPAHTVEDPLSQSHLKSVDDTEDTEVAHTEGVTELGLPMVVPVVREEGSAVTDDRVVSEGPSPSQWNVGTHSSYGDARVMPISTYNTLFGAAAQYPRDRQRRRADSYVGGKESGRRLNM